MIRDLINEKRASAGLNSIPTGQHKPPPLMPINRHLNCSGEVLEKDEKVVWLKTSTGKRCVFRKDYDAWMRK